MTVPCSPDERRLVPATAARPAMRLMLEDLSGGELQSGGIGSGDDLDAQDEVAAELEEVVVDAHRSRRSTSPQILTSASWTGVCGAL